MGKLTDHEANLRNLFLDFNLYLCFDHGEGLISYTPWLLISGFVLFFPITHVP